MEIDGATLATITTAIGGFATSAIGMVKYVKGTIRRSDIERKEAYDALRAQHKEAQDRCHHENESLVLRVQALEARSHNEGREDRSGMMKIIQCNADAFAVLAEMIPRSPTPPEGNVIR